VILEGEPPPTVVTVVVLHLTSFSNSLSCQFHETIIRFLFDVS